MTSASAMAKATSRVHVRSSRLREDGCSGSIGELKLGALSLRILRVIPIYHERRLSPMGKSLTVQISELGAETGGRQIALAKFDAADPAFRFLARPHGAGLRMARSEASGCADERRIGATISIESKIQGEIRREA